MKILVTGGASCGKSTWAEHLAEGLPGPRHYIATMRPLDEECLARIARHRKMRAGKGFETIEQYTGVGGVDIAPGGTVLLECVCNLVANEMFDEQGNKRSATRAVLRDVAALEGRCGHLVVVTNEVGGDGAQYDENVVEYVRTVGEVNAALAARFDAVVELCCGIPLVLKGTLP